MWADDEDVGKNSTLIDAPIIEADEEMDSLSSSRANNRRNEILASEEQRLQLPHEYDSSVAAINNKNNILTFAK